MSVTSFANTRNGLLSAVALAALLGCIPGIGAAQAATTGSTSTSTIAYSALINKFTNSYWLNGSWRASAGVSVAATAQNKAAFGPGVSVRTADGQIRTITSVKPASGGLTMFMNGPVLDGKVVG